MFNNELVGDVSAVQALIPNLASDGNNWIEGSVGKFKICAKVFAEQSCFGIKKGRISKLQINTNLTDEYWGFDDCVVNFDRGWDIRPKNEPERVFLNQLLEAFGDDPLEGDDYIWYDLYCYASQDDFDNGHRNHIMSVNTKKEALEEANYYRVGDEYGFEIIKVRCSDDEADNETIIHLLPIEETA